MPVNELRKNDIEQELLLHGSPDQLGAFHRRYGFVSDPYQDMDEDEQDSPSLISAYFGLAHRLRIGTEPDEATGAVCLSLIWAFAHADELDAAMDEITTFLDYLQMRHEVLRCR